MVFFNGKLMKKKNRVRDAREFQSILHSPAKAVNPSFVIHWKQRKEAEARIGITLSKKMGIAVKRNLYKRQVRMMCEQLVDFEKCQYDAVLIVRYGYRDLSYADNKKNLEKVLQKATML